MSENCSNHPFRVDIPDLEVSFEVGPQESIVDVARDHGVDILTGCQNGKCGSCVVKVIEGEIDHRDQALLPERQAEGWMCACVSRAKGDSLTLDVW